MGDWGFGIVQAQELERAGKSTFDELCALLSEATQLTFQPIVASSYKELAHGLEDSEVGLAWLPPIPTIDLDARGKATVLAIPSRNGTTFYHSALIVRRGGPRNIVDLKSRRAVWVQRDSAAGYLVPRMHLAALGVDVLRYFSRELFVHSHPAIIDAIVNGEADVGATYCHVREESSPGGARKSVTDEAFAPTPTTPMLGTKVVRGAWIDDEGRSTRPIDVLATYGPIPNDALVGSNELPATARSSITRYLLDPAPRARDLFHRLLGANDFRVPSPGHYDSLKHMLRAARARGQDALPSSSRTGIKVGKRF
jgi:phosphonate transport system substrate-binding protein